MFSKGERYGKTFLIQMRYRVLAFYFAGGARVEMKIK